MDNIFGKGIGTPYLMGSGYFFSEYKDYRVKDIDKIVLVDHPILFKNVMNLRKEDQDIYYWRRMTPEEFVEVTKNSDNPMQIGKFLIPEFSKDIGFTIEHLKQLEDIVNKLEGGHEYEKIIYRSYIENNDFILTPEQRDLAYSSYKKGRNYVI